MALIRGRDRETSAKIFTASMADIVLDRTRMELPDSTVRVKIPEEDKPAVISIAPRSEGFLIRVSTGEEMSLPVSTDEEVVTFASTEVARDPNKAFIVKADEEVPYERFDAVLDALKQSKVKYIYLLSDQKTVE